MLAKSEKIVELSAFTLRKPPHRVEKSYIYPMESLSDFDLLVVMLKHVLLHENVEHVARDLLSAFGDINGILAARPARISRVCGRDQEIVLQLKAMEAIGHRMARSKVPSLNVLDSWDKLLNYLRVSMSHQLVEHFRVLFLNRKNSLISDEVLSKGTVDHVPVYPREIMRRAFDLDAAAIILVHNHPSGDTTPSEADISMTYQIRDIAESLGVFLHDHLIIGSGKELSFRSEGIL